MFDRAKAHVDLLPGDEESLAIIDLLPPIEAAISLVEHVSRAGLDRNVAADLDIVDVGRRYLDAGRDIGQGIVDDVQLHATDAAIPFGPLADFVQRYRAGVDQAHHFRPLTPCLAIGRVRQHRKDLRKNADRAARIGIRQRRADELIGAQMVMVLRIGVEGSLQRPQAINAGQLRVHQRDQVIPALERLVVGIPVVLVHNLLKLLSIDRF